MAGITKEQFRDAISQVKSFVLGKTSNMVPNTRTINGKALSEDITLKASDIGADPSGTAANQITSHNISTTAHNDIRLLITGLTDRLNALADSDDTTLDQMKEVVAYIKANRELIESVTTSKINVADIIDNLETNVSDKPLSAAQGVVLKLLIDALKSDLTAIQEKISWTHDSFSIYDDGTTVIAMGEVFFSYSYTKDILILRINGLINITATTSYQNIIIEHDTINSNNFSNPYSSSEQIVEIQNNEFRIASVSLNSKGFTITLNNEQGNGDNIKLFGSVIFGGK